jgi:hypothetical protein
MWVKGSFSLSLYETIRYKLPVIAEHWLLPALQKEKNFTDWVRKCTHSWWCIYFIIIWFKLWKYCNGHRDIWASPSVDLYIMLWEPARHHSVASLPVNWLTWNTSVVQDPCWTIQGCDRTEVAPGAVRLCKPAWLLYIGLGGRTDGKRHRFPQNALHNIMQGLQGIQDSSKLFVWLTKMVDI